MKPFQDRRGPVTTLFRYMYLLLQYFDITYYLRYSFKIHGTRYCSILRYLQLEKRYRLSISQRIINRRNLDIA